MERINKQQTYSFLNIKNKWLGIIDYKTLSVFLVYIYVVCYLVNYLNIENIYKLYVIVIFVLPAIIFILLNLNEECIIDKLIIIIKFILKRKLYVNSSFYTKTDIIYVKNVEENHIVKSKK